MDEHNTTMNPIRKKILAYSRLTRLRLAPTAISNSTFGYWLSQENSFAHAITIAIISLCLYSAGMTLNDIVDKNKDKLSNPQRPLPKGEIKYHEAIFLTLALFTLSATLAGLYLNAQRLLWYGITVTCILVYNFTKELWPKISPVWMGGCRCFNFTLGLGHWHTTLSLIYFFYTALLTYLSLLEDKLAKQKDQIQRYVFTLIASFPLLDACVGLLYTQKYHAAFFSLWMLPCWRRKTSHKNVP
ncbi:MAG: hypothetical protein D6805_01880 [Planctomycetota bacterium]|nr:MAG: hypothetical protein D6805_01880 [Planctomycetota bacterium]